MRKIIYKIRKAAYGAEACLFGFEYLIRGQQYPRRIRSHFYRAHANPSFSEILNRIGRQEDKPEYLDRMVPLVIMAILFISVTAVYYSMVHTPQLP